MADSDSDTNIDSDTDIDSVPFAGSVLVARPRLLARLNAAPGVVVVCAPAGWGKTTLLSEWSRTRPEPVAWIGFEEGHSDEASLVDTIGVALAAASPEDGSAFEAIRLSGRPAADAVRSLAATAGRRGRVSVVIDDAHHANVSAASAGLLATFCANLPPGARLVIGSRVRPDFISARDVVHGGVVEITREDLAMDGAETAGLLGAGVRSGRFVDRAHAVTEGWPAGLRALKLILEKAADPEQALDTLREEGHDVGEYLGREVIAHLIPGDRRILEAVSVLAEVTPAACRALTGEERAWKRLLRLERAGMFVRTAGRRRTSVRIHALLRDELRRELRRRRPVHACRLYLRCARHHALRDRPERALDDVLEALDIAIAAGAPLVPSVGRRAGDLLEEAAGPMLMRGGRQWLLDRISRLPAQERAVRPYLERIRAWASQENGETTAWPPIPEASPLAGHARCIDAAIRADRALRSGAATELTGAALEARSAMPRGDGFLRSVVVSLLQAAYRFGGDPAVAAAAIEETTSLAERTHRPAEAVQARAMLGVLHMMQGRLHAAEEALNHGLALAESALGGDASQAGMCHQFLGYVAWEWNQLDRARTCLDAALRIARPLRHHGILSGTLRMLSATDYRLGDEAASRRALSELESLVDTPAASARNREWMDGVRASYALMTGSRDTLAEWISRWRYDARSAARAALPELHARFQEYHTLAHALIVLGRSREAIPLIRALGVAAAAGGRRGFRVVALALESAALESIGETGVAVSALRAALREGEAENMVRAIAESPPPLSAVLARLPADGIDGEYVERIRLAAGVRSGRAASPTARERDVLVLLAGGLSNKAIARRLGLSLATVKTHLNHLFAKLGARNRTHLIAQARHAGYLREGSSRGQASATDGPG
jgi:ATP/maltotriose-dependent transcriptional regulator MalT